MPDKSSLAICAVAALPLFLATVPAAAQNQTSPIAQPGTASLRPRHVSGRITIHPGRLLYRRCVDWYELQHRPNGAVLYPQMRCSWVRG